MQIDNIAPPHKLPTHLTPHNGPILLGNHTIAKVGAEILEMMNYKKGVLECRKSENNS
jgi:hypothetical protein